MYLSKISPVVYRVQNERKKKHEVKRNRVETNYYIEIGSTEQLE